MNLFEFLFQYSERRPATGALKQEFAALAQKAGLENVSLHVLPSNYYNAMAAPQKNGANEVWVSQGALEIAGSAEAKGTSDELRAVLGHELEHLRRGVKKDMTIARSLRGLTPVVALAGYYYYRRATASGAEQPHEVESFVDASFEQEIDKAKAQGERPHDTSMMRAVKYAAVGIAGVVAGSLMSRGYMRHVEFACDAGGAKLTSPEAMIEGLKFLDKAVHHSQHGIRRDIEKGIQSGKLSPLELVKHMYNEMTIIAHPSLEERVAALQKLKPVVSHVEHEGKVAAAASLQL